ncbi:keratin-associated protein 5-11-like [Neltuma alba]|uniref:keratin-associated protein 5-11-like n=1 Tax=Neltuma alba TaxID=207710 RepID=UPI0010A41341|nr:keratin-associated protein 5-11-like [Prosopis alba]
MECESSRNKALKIASMIKGVTSVAIEGDSKDKVVVTGEDVDTVCLGRMLRKKFRCVTVLTVEEVKPKKEDDKDKPKCCTLCVVPLHPCVRCHSPKCDGGCKPCCKCQSPRCDGGCKPCCKCQSPRCDGGCKPCCKCQSHRCDGGCKPCCKCQSHR